MGTGGPTCVPWSQPAFGGTAPRREQRLTLGCGQGLPAPPGQSADAPAGGPGRGAHGRIRGQHPGDSAGQRARPCPRPRDYRPAGESILILFNTNQGGGALQLSGDLGGALAHRPGVSPRPPGHSVSPGELGTGAATPRDGEKPPRCLPTTHRTLESPARLGTPTHIPITRRREVTLPR